MGRIGGNVSHALAILFVLGAGTFVLAAAGQTETDAPTASQAPTRSDIKTLEAGVLKVAVTSGAPTNPFDSQLWIRRYVERFAAELQFEIAWVVVPFNESWLLASRDGDGVDLVATNVASFADRKHPGATFSAPFLYEQRALRIRPEDEGRYGHIDDFVGKTVGVVRGMAAERDVRRRAPEGVIIHTAETFEELYAEFDAGRLDAIAEAEYFALDGSIIPSYGDDVVLIDHHDLNPGQREESVFVVRDASTNLLAAVNQFIARTKFPP
jgi:ABC-type amino acid transport substrate-binding protein